MNDNKMGVFTMKKHIVLAILNIKLINLAGMEHQASVEAVPKNAIFKKPYAIKKNPDFKYEGKVSREKRPVSELLGCLIKGEDELKPLLCPCDTRLENNKIRAYMAHCIKRHMVAPKTYKCMIDGCTDCYFNDVNSYITHLVDIHKIFIIKDNYLYNDDDSNDGNENCIEKQKVKKQRKTTYFKCPCGIEIKGNSCRGYQKHCAKEHAIKTDIRNEYSRNEYYCFLDNCTNCYPIFNTFVQHLSNEHHAFIIKDNNYLLNNEFAIDNGEVRKAPTCQEEKHQSTTKKTQRFKCPCGIELRGNSLNALKEHCSQSHAVRQPGSYTVRYPCFINNCGMILTTAEKLIKHLIDHKVIDGRIFYAVDEKQQDPEVQCNETVSPEMAYREIPPSPFFPDYTLDCINLNHEPEDDSWIEAYMSREKLSDATKSTAVGQTDNGSKDVPKQTDNTYLFDAEAVLAYESDNENDGNLDYWFSKE